MTIKPIANPFPSAAACVVDELVLELEAFDAALCVLGQHGVERPSDVEALVVALFDEQAVAVAAGDAEATDRSSGEIACLVAAALAVTNVCGDRWESATWSQWLSDVLDVTPLGRLGSSGWVVSGVEVKVQFGGPNVTVVWHGSDEFVEVIGEWNGSASRLAKVPGLCEVLASVAAAAAFRA